MNYCEMEEKSEKQDGLKCIKITNTHPDRLSEEGKKELAMNIIEELSIEEINKFIRGWGYSKK